MSLGDAERGQRPPLWPGLLAVALAVLVVAVVSVRNDMPFSTLTRDPLELAGLRWQTGLLYKLSLMVWGATAGGCLVAAAVWRRIRDAGGLARFLFASGVLMAVLAVDDAFQIRDEIDDHLGIPEAGVFVVYAAVLCVFAIAFARMVLRTEYGVLVAAFAVAVVWLGLRQAGLPLAIQDGVRFVGQLLLLLYFYRAGVYGLSRTGAGG